jgi:hypothetical protein
MNWWRVWGCALAVTALLFAAMAYFGPFLMGDP